MKPEELIKIVFEFENVDLELKQFKSNKRELVQAKQRAMYMLKFFFHELTWKQCAGYFNQKHDQGIYAYTKVTDLIATDRAYEKQIARLINIIQGKLANKLKVNCVSAEFRMLNKRAILHKTDEGFIILLKRLNGRIIEKKHISISSDAMAGIVESYNLLNK
jgi:hypothetical protein